MKFNKRKLVTYQAKLKLEDNDDLLYGISSQVKGFIEAVSQKIDNEGHKCDEYDLLYSANRIERNLNFYGRGKASRENA